MRTRARVGVVAASALSAGYMVFDAGRALLVGDYVTPSAGAHAGRLGPWADLVQAIGVDPRGLFMKTFFVVYGLYWLAAAGFYVAGRPGAWKGVAGFAAGSLWYASVGTVLSLVQLAVLAGVHRRRAV